MITASQDLKDVFYESRTVNISAGCTIEYNMNMLLDNITISTTATDADYINGISTSSGEIVRVNPFKKLFPLDSIIKPYRPVNSGIKNYILLDSDHEGANKFYDYRTIPYPSNAPRVYYAGVTNYYKYWVTPQNTGVNVTVKYVQSTATISEAYATTTKVVYKTNTEHGFTVGKRITISGSGDSYWNLTNKIITEISDARTFVVSNIRPIEDPEDYFVTPGLYNNSLSKTATLVNSAGTSTPTKPALANKIVVKFEKYHSLPATCTISIDYNDATQDVTLSPISVPSNGILEIYYNGTTWSINPPFSSSQAVSYPSPKQIKSISITTPSAGSERIIAVTEISARWLKDISSDIVSFNIDKESTSNPEDILPVGNITANSLSLNVAKYNQDNLKLVTYNRDEDWKLTTGPNPIIDTDILYFAKNIQIVPHLKIYHSLGAVTEGSLKYDRVIQGTFFLDSHSISQFGDAQITALDGSKQLMETLMPDLIYENAPVTSIIMSMLDSIGFSNYNINIATESGEVIDKSIATLTYWWSENNKTIWNAIQELCRDIQMNAFFDENNILQFYTRDYLYSKINADWTFTYAQDGEKLPNIVTFDQQEIVSANQVKILWKTPMSSLYTQSSRNFWESEPSFLIAGGLRDNGQAPAISKNTPAELVDFNIDIDNLDVINNITSAFTFNGYFLVDSEVFEFDAIEYRYIPIGTTSEEKAFIGSEGDWAQYRALSETGPQNFKPTGKYRIKARALFGTEAQDHIATGGTITGWYLIPEDTWN